MYLTDKMRFHIYYTKIVRQSNTNFLFNVKQIWSNSSEDLSCVGSCDFSQ